MPLLLYCVAPENAPATSSPGVGGAAVASETLQHLRWFYSDSRASSSVPVIDAARQFNAVLQDIFSRNPVLPFRYPTTLPSHAELEKLAAGRAAAFRVFLDRIGHKAQIDIRLSVKDAPTAANSGTGYLHSRAARRSALLAAAQICRETAMAADFKVTERGENFRCAALFPRPEVVSWLQRMRTLELPDGVQAVVSGPWPPTAFWEDDPVELRD